MLVNKVIIVTGGSGLIGREIVRDIQANGGIAINADIAKSEGEFVHCDITSEESVTNLISTVDEKYGRIDGLVNNAYPRTKDWGNHFQDIKLESWKQNVDLQLNSCFGMSQAYTAYLLQQKHRGALVNIASIYGVVGADFNVYSGTPMTNPAAYSAIKGGVINFTRYLASLYGRDGIRVNCVSPGGIFDHQPELFVNNYNAKVPMGRMGNPDDIAPSVTFLLSDKAKYITGHNLIVDGGWTCI